MRVDAIRQAIEERFTGTPLHPVLLAALLVAADRVDSTTGVQMAYLKQWAPRAHRDLRLELPALLAGPGRTVTGDVFDTVATLPAVDLAYLDPPYNQHRYFTNYHVWETLVRWDAPEHYGIACKRIDARDESTKSVFNRRATMPAALAALFAQLRAEVVVVSYNDEAWIAPEEMMRSLRDAGHAEVRLLAFDSKRYVGAQIGIHGPTGEKVGRVSHLRNTEYVFVAGPPDRVAAAVPHDEAAVV
jgi:adenine-specific DNA-methyltransferase